MRAPDCQAASTPPAPSPVIRSTSRRADGGWFTRLPVLDAWSFTDAEIAEAIDEQRLLNPSIDLSNSCNLNCPYCFVEDRASADKRRRPNELRLEETLKVVEDFAAAGARTLNLVGAGEPTIDPHFRAIVERTADLNMRTMLFTNGISIAREPALARWLIDRKVSIALKFNSRRPELQDALAGRVGYTKQRDNALRILLATGFAKDMPTRLALDVLVMAEVYAELPRIYLWCRTNNVHPIFAEYVPTGRTSQGDRILALGSTTDPSRHNLGRLDANRRARLAADLASIDKASGLPVPERPCAYFGGERCTQLLGVYVDIQGLVWPCVARTQLHGGVPSHQPLGTVRQASTSASGLWRNHPAMEQLRREYTGACPYKLPIPIAAGSQ